MGLLIKLLLVFWAILQNIFKQEASWALSCNMIVRSWQKNTCRCVGWRFVCYVQGTFLMKRNAINQSSYRSHILGGTSRPAEAKMPTNIQKYATHNLMLGFLSLSAKYQTRMDEVSLAWIHKLGIVGSYCLQLKFTLAFIQGAWEISSSWPTVGTKCHLLVGTL